MTSSRDKDMKETVTTHRRSGDTIWLSCTADTGCRCPSATALVQVLLLLLMNLLSLFPFANNFLLNFATTFLSWSACGRHTSPLTQLMAKLQSAHHQAGTDG